MTKTMWQPKQPEMRNLHDALSSVKHKRTVFGHTMKVSGVQSQRKMERDFPK